MGRKKPRLLDGLAVAEVEKDFQLIERSKFLDNFYSLLVFRVQKVK